MAANQELSLRQQRNNRAFLGGATQVPAITHSACGVTAINVTLNTAESMASLQLLDQLEANLERAASTQYGR